MVPKNEAKDQRARQSLQTMSISGPYKKKDRSPLQQPEVLSKYPFEDLTIFLLGSDLEEVKEVINFY